MLEKIKKTIQNLSSIRFLRFLIVGGVNTLIDFCIFNIVLMVLILEAFENEIVVAKIIGFLFASGNSYILNSVWTFSSSEKRTKNNYLRFMYVSLMGVFINVSAAYGVYTVGIYALPLQPILIANIAFICAVCASLVWNYFGYKRFVFRS